MLSSFSLVFTVTPTFGHDILSLQNIAHPHAAEEECLSPSILINITYSYASHSLIPTTHTYGWDPTHVAPQVDCKTFARRWINHQQVTPLGIPPTSASPRTKQKRTFDLKYVPFYLNATLILLVTDLYSTLFLACVASRGSRQNHETNLPRYTCQLVSPDSS